MVSILSLTVARSYRVLQPCYNGTKEHLQLCGFFFTICYNGVNEELHLCERIVTMVFKSSDSGVAVVCHAVDTVSVGGEIILSSVVAESQGCNRFEVQWCYSGDIVMFQ
jgi:hypothetical protein